MMVIYTDPKTAELGRAAARAFGDAFPALADNFSEFIEDNEERKTFGERAKEEFASGRYHCYFKMYDFLIMLMVREMVLGRKPFGEFDVNRSDV